MRTIKVKHGSSKYKLVGDGGTPIGILEISYDGVDCKIGIAHRYGTVNTITIDSVAPPKKRRRRT